MVTPLSVKLCYVARDLWRSMNILNKLTISRNLQQFKSSQRLLHITVEEYEYFHDQNNIFMSHYKIK